MRKVGFIGLGAMGFPMAVNLLNAGYELFVGYHKNRKYAEFAEEKGAVICESYKEVANNSDTVITMVPNAPEVEEVIFGQNGLIEGLKAGTTIIDMSTIDFTKSQEFSERLKSIGVNFMDAPVSGGPEGAEAGTLAIMAGGDKQVFESHREMLEVMGSKVVYCGKNGMGLAVKMANNLIVGTTMVAISEAYSIAIKAGADPDDVFEVLKGATANSVILNNRVPKFLQDSYEPGFKLSLMCKDLDIINSVAKKIGTPTLAGSMVEQIFNMCKNEYGDKDMSAVSLFYQEHSKISFKSKKE